MQTLLPHVSLQRTVSGMKTIGTLLLNAVSAEILNPDMRLIELPVCVCPELGIYGCECVTGWPSTSLCTCIKIVFENIKFTNINNIADAKICDTCRFIAVIQFLPNKMGYFPDAKL